MKEGYVYFEEEEYEVPQEEVQRILMERLKEVAHVTQGVIDKGSDLWNSSHIYLIYQIRHIKEDHPFGHSRIKQKTSAFFDTRKEMKLIGNNSMWFEKYNTFIGMTVIKIGFNGKNILLGRNIKDL